MHHLHVRSFTLAILLLLCSNYALPVAAEDESDVGRCCPSQLSRDSLRRSGLWRSTMLRSSHHRNAEPQPAGRIGSPLHRLLFLRTGLFSFSRRIADGAEP